MYKVSFVLAERCGQDPLETVETYFCKQHPPGASEDNLPLYDFGMPTSFETKNCSSQ